MKLEEINDRVKLLWPNREFTKVYMSGGTYWDQLHELIPSQLIRGLKKHHEVLDNALSQGQIKSKQWLLENLQGIDLGMVFICAGWYGILATMMFEDENIFVDKIRSFDIDDNCWKIAEDLNEPWKTDNWRFKATTLDIVSFFTDGYFGENRAEIVDDGIACTWSHCKKSYFYYTTNVKGLRKLCKEVPDTIINTSCEHIEKFTEWFNAIPKGKLVALQTNNYFDLPEHVNCVKNLAEFKEQAPLSDVIFGGRLELEKYTRFMLIGYV